MDKLVIRFNGHSGVYVAGDIAGFPPAIAHRYVDAGVAGWYPPLEKKPAEDEKKAEPKSKAARAPRNRKAPKGQTK